MIRSLQQDLRHALAGVHQHTQSLFKEVYSAWRGRRRENCNNTAITSYPLYVTKDNLRPYPLPILNKKVRHVLLVSLKFYFKIDVVVQDLPFQRPSTEVWRIETISLCFLNATGCRAIKIHVRQFHGETKALDQERVRCSIVTALRVNMRGGGSIIENSNYVL